MSRYDWFAGEIDVGLIKDFVKLQHAEEEPSFVLRARDQNAPDTIRFWAQRAIEDGIPVGKIDEALACADAMEIWRDRLAKIEEGI